MDLWKPPKCCFVVLYDTWQVLDRCKMPHMESRNDLPILLENACVCLIILVLYATIGELTATLWTDSPWIAKAI